MYKFQSDYWSLCTVICCENPVVNTISIQKQPLAAKHGKTNQWTQYLLGNKISPKIS